MAPPDIGYYYDELERRGNWRPALDGETTTPITADPSPLAEFITSHEVEETVSEEEVEETLPEEEESEEEN